MHRNVHHALIIAAGSGERFGEATHFHSKPLIEVAGVPLICRTILTAQKAGIDHFTVVTGYKAPVLEEFLTGGIYLPGLKIQCLRNDRWQRPNGLSVLQAKGHLRGSFALLMADHIFDARILKNLIAIPLLPGYCRLAVDFHPERILDLADATKVAVRDGRVTDIGKGIQNYNAVDTGIFLCSQGIFGALETAISWGRESLTDGIRELVRCQRMEAMDIGDLFWQDIDDEAARLEGEKRLTELLQSGRVSDLPEYSKLPLPKVSR
jgi:choline kinase